MFAASHNRVQHELCSARTVHLRDEIQRTADGDVGRGRVFPEAETGLQVGAGAQHNGCGWATVILAGLDATISATNFTHITDAAIGTSGTRLLMDRPAAYTYPPDGQTILCVVGLPFLGVLCRGSVRTQ